MIVISGALVLVALVLLILGITIPGLSYVYASIVVSLISGVFLGIGILLRRGDKGDAPGQEQQGPAEQPAPVPAAAGARRGGSVAIVDEPEPATATLPASATSGADAEPDADEYDDEEIDPADDRAVLVVAGRPRYHAQGCRYLAGKEAETIHLLDARDEGFTPCGVCKPDNVIAIEDDIAVVPAGEGVEAVVEVYDPATEGGVEEQEPAAEAEEPAALPAADPEPTAELEPAASAPARARRSRGSSAVLEGPSAAATAAAGTTGSGRRAGTVVVIPDRGKFHRAECRYVRGVPGAETRSKTQAAKQGFTACGVCKP